MIAAWRGRTDVNGRHGGRSGGCLDHCDELVRGIRITLDFDFDGAVEQIAGVSVQSQRAGSTVDLESEPDALDRAVDNEVFSDHASILAPVRSSLASVARPEHS